MTTVWACEKTVVMLKQPGHFTSMKKERGAGTRVYELENTRQMLKYNNKDGRVYLELVLAGLRGGGGVEKIFSENLAASIPVL